MEFGLITAVNALVFVTTYACRLARKRAKKDMKNAPTEFERAVQNGRQVS